MGRDPTLSELPDEFLGWDDLWLGGRDALRAARDSPGAWIVVHDLRPLEFFAMLAFIPFRPMRPSQALMWDADAKRYLCYPAELLPDGTLAAAARLSPMILWRELAASQLPTFRAMGRNLADAWWWLEGRFMGASDHMDRLLRAAPQRRHVHGRR